MAYGQWVTQRHKELAGTRVVFYVNNYIIGPYCSCATVTIHKDHLHCVIRYPHITVSVEDGHRPVESNDLIEQFCFGRGDKSMIDYVYLGFHLDGTCGLFVRDGEHTRWVVGPE